MDDPTPLTRRASLGTIGGFLAAVLGGRALGSADAEAAGPAAVAAGRLTCVLAPEQTEGPYYVEGARLRRDITERRPGTPLTLRLTVVDASTCKPIAGAAVDVWHCDAAGAYSGVGAAAAATFLRGVQRTDAKGLATFRTIYPGWYPGRAVHIHVKVHVAGNVVHTGQLYFPDALTDRVYRKSPYSRRPGRTTRNAADFVFANGGRRSLLDVRPHGSGGYIGAIVMGVSR